MHRTVCDIDSLRDQTDGEPQYAARAEGRAAISCSKSFCKEEFGRLIAWASVNLQPEDFEKLPSWREVKDWPGKIIAVCDYKARDGLNLVLEDGVYKSKPTPKQKWDEGYRFWWDLSNVRRLAEPIPCRGNVGMWQLSESLAAKIEATVSLETSGQNHSLLSYGQRLRSAL